ncbi:MAG: methyl-accepting chemotaxis protein [Bryobacteraceae bacterium]
MIDSTPQERARETTKASRLSVFRDLSLRRRVYVLGAVIAVGFAGFGAAVTAAINTVKVGGPIYNQISLQKELIADILPPPAYILESYLAASEMVGAADVAALNKLVATSKTLQKMYLDRQEYWGAALPEGEIKRLITKTSRDPAMEFYRVQNEHLIPQLQAGNKESARQSFVELTQLYAKHRAEIDKLSNASAAESLRVEQEAEHALRLRLMVLLVVGIAIFLTIILLCLNLKDAAMEPAKRIANVIRKLAAGDLTARATIRKDDEMAEICECLNSFADELCSIMTMLTKTAGELSGSGQALTESSKAVTHNCEETAGKANTVSGAVSEVSKNLQILAASAEEMTASVNESARSTSRFAQRTMEAVGVARGAEGTVNNLRERSAEVGKVLKSISTVTAQINALAQKATMEAKRATDAGKGFAVVANEVKELARESGRASEDISQRIQAIQRDDSGSNQAIHQIMEVVNSISTFARQTNLLSLNATIEASRAIGAGTSFAHVASQVKELATATASAADQINRSISIMLDGSQEATKSMHQIQALIVEINEASHSIASSVEEQSAAMKEIAHSVSAVASSGDTIAVNISGVAGAAEESTQGANISRKAAEKLRSISGDLTKQVERFTLAPSTRPTADVSQEVAA